MQYPQHAAAIIAMKAADLALRDQLLQQNALNEGYHPAMAALHAQHARQLQAIMEAIGYPTIDRVGAEGSAAAWLLIQHAIGCPSFMKRSLVLLEQVVRDQQANPQELAYLSDRIAVFEGQPQLYGTQFDWDAEGRMSPQPYDDLDQVNRRRAALGLNTLEAQTALLRARVLAEGQRPPEDRAAHRQAYETWKKEVGWIT